MGKIVNKRRYVVPEGMLKAAVASVQDGGFDRYRIFLEAALGWLAENPIVPTPEQHMDISGIVRSQVEHDDLTMWHFWAEWQRRMFLAPEPEIPEAVKDLIYENDIRNPGPYWAENLNASILEAYRRGRKEHS